MNMSSNLLFEPTFDAALNTLCCSQLTPWLICKAEGLELPLSLRQHVRDGRIIFNISAPAVRSLIKKDSCLYLDIGDRMGDSHMLVVPYENVLAMVAKEDQSHQVKFVHPKKQRVTIESEPLHEGSGSNVISLFPSK